MSLEMELFDPFRKKKKFENFMQDFFEPMKLPLSAGLRSPLVDIRDKEKMLEVTAELPGVEKKDIDIDIQNGSIAIRTEMHREKKEETKSKGYYFHERAYSGFYRMLPLPSEVIPGRAKAEFSNGLLRIEIPKAKLIKAAGKKFKVKVK
ncbi:MAG: Hsp20/alpha crystallin family protein [Candidatus ainarchaeum sp.]|nr:Hsp20/alpha crystallin family protein [Candidatus ainarchaeum sp.]